MINSFYEKYTSPDLTTSNSSGLSLEDDPGLCVVHKPLGIYIMARKQVYFLALLLCLAHVDVQAEIWTGETMRDDDKPSSSNDRMFSSN